MIAINIHKTKYKILDDIMPSIADKITSINVYIDLNSILRGTLAPHIDIPLIHEQNEVSMAASIINLVAHYREYFYRNNKATKFYLIYNNQAPINSTREYADYGNVYYSKINGSSTDKIPTVNITNKNIELAQKVLRYVNDANIITMNEVDQLVIAAHLMTERTAKTDVNLIITKDEAWAQLINHPRTMILNTKRDNSKIFFKSSVVDGIQKSLSKSGLNDQAISLYQTVKGLKHRNLSVLDNSSSIIKQISEEGYNRIHINIRQFLDKLSLDIETKNEIESRFKALDAFYQEAQISMIQSDKIEKQLIDKYSYTKLKEYSNTVFTHADNVLYLEELVRGDGGIINEKYEIKWKV